MALLNIAALSQRTGVAPDTLRKWEQRYGVLQPNRTPGGQRRYTELDVARVEWLQARLQESYRIGEAAALLSGLGVDAPRTPARLRAALREAMERAEAVELARLLDHAFSLMKLDQAITGIVEPLLTEIGRAWAAGEVTPAQEHLVSEAVQSRLGRLLADARSGVRGCVVLACAPGERHEIGLTALAALLHADGWGVAYLGADTPAADALELAGIAGSLGGPRTLVAHPASTTHRQLDADARRAAGIADGLLRISVGLEDQEDIVADLEQALEKA